MDGLTPWLKMRVCCERREVEDELLEWIWAVTTLRSHLQGNYITSQPSDIFLLSRERKKKKWWTEVKVQVISILRFTASFEMNQIQSLAWTNRCLNAPISLSTPSLSSFPVYTTVFQTFTEMAEVSIYEPNYLNSFGIVTLTSLLCRLVGNWWAMLSSRASSSSRWLEDGCPCDELLSDYFSLSGLVPKHQYPALGDPESCRKSNSVCAGPGRERWPGCTKGPNYIRSSVPWIPTQPDAILRGRPQFLPWNRHYSGLVAYSRIPFQRIPGFAIWYWKPPPCTCPGTWSGGKYHQCIFWATVDPTTEAGKPGWGNSAVRATQLGWDSTL